MKRKLLKILVSVVAVGVLIFCNSYSERAFASQNNETGDIPIEIVNKARSQEKALKAYSQLWNSFTKDEDGMVIYPEEYGGEYIENDCLYIELTDISEETIDDYSERCESLDCVRFVKADYSLNELEQYDKLSYELLQQYSVVSFGVDRKNNRYEICVETNDYNEVVHEVNKMGLGDIIHVKSSGKALLCSTPIIGGYRIDKVNNTGSFTACIGGYYNGQEALLTAGHNNEGSPNFYRSGSLIGSVTMQRCNTVANNTSISAYGDFAVIALNSNYNGTNTIQSSSGTVVSITGTFSSAPVGTTIFKYGYSTGHSWGIVSMVNETVVSYGNLYQYTVRGLTRSVMQNATQTNAINYGDSGGPVYINDGTYKLQGSVQGFQLPQNGGVNSVMRSSPIYYTVQAGFTPKTY